MPRDPFLDQSQDQGGPQMPALKTGQRLFNRRYELRQLLGAGGMGVVWLAWDHTEQIDVALKFLPTVIALQEREMQRLRDEVRAGKELRHENLVATYGMELEDGTAAIVLEYVAGETLRQKLDDQLRGFCEPDEIRRWVQDVCEGLTYLHEKARRIHRDLKPANIILDAGDRVKVMDFGISHRIKESVSRYSKSSEDASRTNGSSSTLAYASPQQISGKPSTSADDIYSLGAMLYELLTGTPPFFRGGVDAVRGQIKDERVTPLMERRQELVEEGLNAGVGERVPGDIEAVVLSCLEKDREKRPQSASKVAQSFSPASRQPKRRLSLRDILLLCVLGVPTVYWVVFPPKERPILVKPSTPTVQMPSARPEVDKQLPTSSLIDSSKIPTPAVEKQGPSPMRSTVPAPTSPSPSEPAMGATGSTSVDSLALLDSYHAAIDKGDLEGARQIFNQLTPSLDPSSNGFLREKEKLATLEIENQEFPETLKKLDAAAYSVLAKSSFDAAQLETVKNAFTLLTDKHKRAKESQKSAVDQAYRKLAESVLGVFNEIVGRAPDQAELLLKCLPEAPGKGQPGEGAPVFSQLPVLVAKVEQSKEKIEGKKAAMAQQASTDTQTRERELKHLEDEVSKGHIEALANAAQSLPGLNEPDAKTHKERYEALLKVNEIMIAVTKDFSEPWKIPTGESIDLKPLTGSLKGAVTWAYGVAKSLRDRRYLTALESLCQPNITKYSEESRARIPNGVTYTPQSAVYQLVTKVIQMVSTQVGQELVNNGKAWTNEDIWAGDFPTHPTPEARQAVVELVQAALLKVQYIDGLAGPETVEAILQYELENKKEGSGKISSWLVKDLGIYLAASAPDKPSKTKYEKKDSARGALRSLSLPGSANPNNPFINSLGMEFVPIGAGPSKRQRILFSVWETRSRDYAAFVKDSGHDAGEDWKTALLKEVPVGRGAGEDAEESSHPVANVSHDDAVAFCAWLTKKDRVSGLIGPKDEYRLPTDTEWSYAVGIGEKEDASASPKDKDGKLTEIYPWGGSFAASTISGNYADETAKEKGTVIDSTIPDYTDGYATTAPVGSFKANSLGLHDLGGNLWEWTSSEWVSGSISRVLRGGSWVGVAESYLLSSCRSGVTRDSRYDIFGFRCVLVVGGGG